MLDGAGPVSRFFNITLPWLKPNLFFISVVATINALMAFDLLWIMTRGGPGAATTVLSWLGYLTSFQFLRFGEGASILYCLTILSFLLAIVYIAGARAATVEAGRVRPTSTATPRLALELRSRTRSADGDAAATRGRGAALPRPLEDLLAPRRLRACSR